MAIFRAETKHISRSKKHNVVAAAAYRAGQKLTDTNEFNPDATTHDYTKKHGVLASDIILPASLINQNFSIDRQALWSSVEQHETTTRSVKGSRLKQSARLAREWLLSLPSELSDEENEQLTREFTTKLVNDLSVIADYALHKPTPFDIKPKKSKDNDNDEEPPALPDSRNVHAHIMFTTRKAELNSDNELIFTDKADSERSEKWRQEQGLVNGGDYIKEIRKLWADMINKRLEQKNILPVTAKSYKDLGLNIIPQHKQGKNATVMSRYHFEPGTVRLNDDIKHTNSIIIKSAADRSIAREQREAAIDDQRTRQADSIIDKADSWLSRANIVVDKRAKSEPPKPTATRVTTKSSATREREQLITQRSKIERRANRNIEQLHRALTNNFDMIAGRLAWRKEHSDKYDDRQMQVLDKFYKTLDIQDFKLSTTDDDNYNYVAPSLWNRQVKDKLTLDNVLNNLEIVSILADADKEREQYLAKTSQNASDGFEIDKQYDSSLGDSKALNRAIETSARRTNRFRP